MATEFDRIRADVIQLVIEMAPEPLPKGVDAGLADFVEDLAYHSVALVELGFAVEERFALAPITAEEVENVMTADDLATFVAQRLAGTSTTSASALR